MIYCKNCGVELEENANICSLCGQPVSDKNSAELDYLTSGKTKKTAFTDFQKLTQLQKRKIFWEIAGMILISGILITSTINLVSDHAITWSKYIITVGLVLFVNITLISFLYRKLFLLFFLSFLTSATLIFFLDIYTGNTGWITKLGIPLLLAAYIIVLFSILIEKKTKQKGLNLIAYWLIASGLLCVCIDGIISIYTKNSLDFGWSLTVMVSAILVSSLLLYVHNRLKKVTDLKRFFHI
jgi:hypothetical protein